MKEQFGIRPKPKTGESLTGYLMRICFLNGANSEAMFKTIRKVRQGNGLREMYRIDIDPDSFVEIDQVSYLTGQSPNILRSLAFHSTSQKMLFDNSVHSDYQTHTKSVSACLSKKYRRFCMECLKERGVYDLIWQVSEIEMCQKHQILLTERCPRCDKQQPYISQKAPRLMCNYCDAKLYENHVKADNDEFIATPLQYYDDWLILMDKNIPFVQQIDSLSTYQSLNATLLYLAQQRYNGIHLFSQTKDHPQIIKKWKHNLHSSTHLGVQLHKLLTTLRKLEVSVRTLSSTTVPGEFINSLFLTAKAGQACLTPWCSAKGNNDKMARLNPRMTLHNGSTYSDHCICTGCWIEYGVDTQDGKWKDIGAFINIIQKVGSELKRKKSISVITIELDISKRLVYRALGYLLNSELLPRTALEKWMPVYTPMCLADCFKKAISLGGRLTSNCRQLYGWSVREFYFYQYNCRVQEYLHLHSNHDRPKNENLGTGQRKLNRGTFWRHKLDDTIRQFEQTNQDFNYNMIVKAMGCGYGVLKHHHLSEYLKQVIRDRNRHRKLEQENELLKRSKIWINDKMKMDESFSRSQLYEYLGIYYKTAAQIYPRLHCWVTNQLTLGRQTRRESQLQEIMQLAKNIVIELKVSGEKLTITSVFDRLGRAWAPFYRNHPEIVAYIKTLIYEDSFSYEHLVKK